METETRIHRCGVVPVVVLEREEYAVPTARALLAGGIDVMEITFRTERLPGPLPPFTLTARKCWWAPVPF